MKKFNKIISFLFIIVLLITIVGSASADLIPLECMRGNPPPYCKYGNYKGPLYLSFSFYHPGLVFMINFLSILIVAFLLCYFFLKYKNIKKIILGSLLAAISGVIIDSISLKFSLIIHNYFYSTYLLDVSGLEQVFRLSLFVVSFILLGIMYYLIIRKLFKINLSKRVIWAAIILAILTNPMWLA
jgi:hypothetical protein